MRPLFSLLLAAASAVFPLGCDCGTGQAPPVKAKEVTLDYTTPVDAAWQAWLEKTDAALRAEFGMTEADTAAGLMELSTSRLALVRPDRIEYAASVAKIGILLAWFDLHPEAPAAMDPAVERKLGLMAKISSNEAAADFSREMGLKNVQAVLDRRGFYDAAQGGGLWVGRHYGKSDERFGDPLADHSHAATVRQVMRFFLFLEQGKLVSPEASAVMRRIFDSPELPHDDIKFVKGLAGRPVTIRRKWGTWLDWKHDAAVVSGPGRHYILCALTHHPRGDEYLERLAAAADDLVTATSGK